MGLKYTGDTLETQHGTSFKATDSNSGRIIVVRVSSEVMRDYGSDCGKRVGEEKYDKRQFLSDGFVEVRTEDIKPAAD